ncbi:ankyrin repeat and SOCS box protein 1 [Engraulis encrasicolus]|uniref:ankyrin repeat and SOCS box protein 1 n=1 Tax=Engraulis encrasicolus TaxID=184585 RepID=UPI002FD5AFE9
MADGVGAEGDVDDPPIPPPCPPIGDCPLITVSDLPSTTPAGRTLKKWLQEQFCDQSADESEARLHNAAFVGDQDTLKLLLEDEDYKRRINEKSVYCCGWLPCTPLRIAASAGHGDCVALLLAQGAEVDLVDVKGQTALYVAVVNGHLDCVRILLEGGANPNGSRHHRSTPLYHASRVGRSDIIQELIRFNADVDVDYQLDQHADPDSSSPRTLSTLGLCPVYITAAYHHLPCFQLLLSGGANPDYNYTGPVSREVLAKSSASCLLDAVLKHGCQADFVSLLLEHGANPYLVPWEEPDADLVGRGKIDPEALRIYQEARRWPRRLTQQCRVLVRRAMGKRRLGHISCLPLPEPIKNFLLHRD